MPGRESKYWHTITESRFPWEREALDFVRQWFPKRRWNTEPWESQLERALRSWLLDRLETYFDFDGRMNDEGKPTAQLDVALVSTGRLAQVARQDTDFLQVGALYRDDPAFDVHPFKLQPFDVLVWDATPSQ